MAKKIVGFVKLQVPAGKANPSPPIGPALGQRGLNIMEFCKAFNAQTQGVEPGLPLPVVITAFADKSFTFIIKTPPATTLNKKAIKLADSQWSTSTRFRRTCRIDRQMSSIGRQYLRLVGTRPKSQASIITQLRTGHVPLNAFLARIKKVDSPLCPSCHRTNESVLHYLVECPTHQRIQRRHRQRPQRPPLCAASSQILLLAATTLPAHAVPEPHAPARRLVSVVKTWRREFRCV